VTIPQNTIEQIRERCDIAEIVGQYVELKRRGRNMVGLCPFHQEKTPSFHVSPERQSFHCFGCGKGGNVFTFLMEMEGVSFPEAVRSLGRRCGVEVEDRRISDADRSRAERLYAANRYAARFYYERLVDPKAGGAARDYLDRRGFPEWSWKKFGLGYAPAAWDALFASARRDGIDREALERTRLVTRSERTGSLFDYFRNRIMFPIVRQGGRVAGFGARTLGDDEPKYLNSAESDVFAKRRTFYGIDQAREAIREQQGALIVEGYTDLIRLHIAGYVNTIAACGTALTTEHASLLRRMTRRALLVPDGDVAGRNAAVRAGAVLLAAGVDVSVVRLESGDDPDSAAARDAGAFSRSVDEAVDYFGFLDYIRKEHARSAREREALALSAIEGLSGLDDPVRRDVVAGELATVLELEPADLRERVRKGALRASRRRHGGTGSPSTAVENDSDAVGSAEMPVCPIDPIRAGRERLALFLALDGGLAAQTALDTLDADDFSVETHRKFYKLLDLARESHIDTRSAEFQRRAEEAGLEGLAAEVALTPVPPGNIEQLLEDTVRRIKKQKIEDELKVLHEKLLDLPSDSEEAVSVAEYYQMLCQALAEL